MSTFLDETPRRRRVTVIVSVAIAVAAAAVLITWTLSRSAGDPPRGSAASASPAPPSPVQQVPAGPLQLVKGKRTVEGISVGYPHTMQGAAIAGAEYLTQILSTLDPQRGRQIASVIADPSFDGAEDEMAQGRLNIRRSLGLPTTGPVPSGASITFGPAAYQLRDASPDTVTVVILAYLTTNSGGQVTPTLGAYPIELHWDGTDWKALRPGASRFADYASLVAQPNTADAAARGWQVLTP
ncbi:hypothetical protein ACI2K4_22065 [Micromonospora sp. NPDC050397]|uniref:hypothetical protein n=1 Tax=Micromonospora sp. NPDC050397 TaxID=3364279 RepID=UPI00384FBAEE